MGIVKLADKSFQTYMKEDEILKIVAKLAKQLNADYADKHPVFLSVLNGSFMFTSDLVKELEIICEISFIKLASYQGTSSSGTVRELIGVDNAIINQHVVVLEDIVDTGNTLVKILEMVNAENPKSLEICSLLFKPDAYKKDYKVKYVGKSIPNDFIVGYGLDYNGLGRNLKNIYKVI